MDLLKEFFGVDAEGDDAASTPTAAPAGEAAGRTEEERQQAREAKREAKRANRQARKLDAATEAKRAEFSDRYKAGHPSEGFTAEEAIEHLQELQQQLTPAEFRRAMEETLNTCVKIRMIGLAKKTNKTMTKLINIALYFAVSKTLCSARCSSFAPRF